MQCSYDHEVGKTMKLIFIRHGDPDYDLDSLTEKGFREAALLAPRFARMKADYVFQSPLGRAQATAKPCLELTGQDAVTYPWLQEFRGRCVRPGETREEICWEFRHMSCGMVPRLHRLL